MSSYSTIQLPFETRIPVIHVQFFLDEADVSVIEQSVNDRK